VEPKSWNSYTPPVREAAIAALVSKPPMLQVLFAAIRRGDVRAPEISSVRRTQLLQHANAGLRAEATALFQSLEGGDRMAIYREYRELLKQPGPPNAAAGAAAYERACSACHTFRGAGGKVGPDLTGVRNQPADALLLHILVPNYEVAPAYQAVTATTQDGRTISGWLVAETEAGLTLRTAAGPEETVLRKSLASLTASGVSLMPDGLELTMTKAELLALIAYLKSEAN
ncbi:MAG: c-type cytochrome, partial [Verrucomicrobia bacterium]|nr:c-type cytochrome [Verrucomicrobiota bacterium]